MVSQKVCCGIIIIVLGLSSLVGLASPAVAADSYRIDSVHSTIIFRVKHLNVTPFYGRFNELSGRIVIDEQNPERSSFEIQIKAQSIDTNDPRRDRHLKSPDFFSARQFPTINFKSTRVKKVTGNTYEVSGNLTLHGVTKPLTLKVEHTGTGSRQGRTISGFGATFSINRSDYGMNFMLSGLSDEVHLMVGLECIRQ